MPAHSPTQLRLFTFQPPPDPPPRLRWTFKQLERKGLLFDLVLVQVMMLVADTTQASLPEAKLKAFNQLLSFAELYGGCVVEWAGCTFRASLEPTPMIEVKVDPFLPRASLAKFAALALLMTVIHRAARARAHKRPLLRICWHAKLCTLTVARTRYAQSA